MSIPSNLYAEKVFSEHPVALWALEEDVDYVSLLSESVSALDSWSMLFGGANITNVSGMGPAWPSEMSSQPYDVADSPLFLMTLFNGGIGFNWSGYMSNLSAPILKSSLNNSIDTFSFGMHVFASNSNIANVSLGVVYTDADTGETVTDSYAFTSISVNNWSFISHTFRVSDINADMFYLYVTATSVFPDGVTDNASLYLQGITLGQESEQFNSRSLGINIANSVSYQVAGISGSTSDTLIQSNQYGISGKNAYYVLRNGKDLLCQNSGMPMVYGASSSTVISNSGGLPALLIPGYGLFNSVGANRQYTAEMWLKVFSNASENRRIFGPIASSDGLYIDGPFLRLKVGTEIASHFIGDVYRPMLVHIKYVDYQASLMINGEEVGSISVDQGTPSFPSQYDNSGMSQDYLAFYTYDDVPSIETDCVAIYSYAVPSIVAKRRFAYGQAVELPENVNTAFGGATVYFDYTFADYTNNYSYPKIGKWSQGISDNLIFDNSILSTPKYSLPQLISSTGEPYDSWIDSNSDLQDDSGEFFFRFDGVDTSSYLYFESLRMLTEDTRAVYIVFEVDDIVDEKQIIFRIDDNSTSNYFEVSATGSRVSYTLVYDGVPTELYADSDLLANTKSFAGIDIDGLARYFGRNFSAFFGNKSRLSLYVGSDKYFNNTLSGKVFSVNLCTARNFSKIAGLFQDPEIVGTDFVADAGDAYFGTQSSYWYRTFDGGYPDSFSLNGANAHIASYTLKPRDILGSYKLDILTDSYWEDYVPLKYFAQYVTSSTDRYYDLDFIQFNVGYPAPKITGTESYNTSNSVVKTYVTFQYLATGATAPQDYFIYQEPAPANNIINPGSNWMTTRYEVVDGTIIYMPRGVSFEDIALVTHIEIQSKGIMTDSIKIKNLEYASQAFNRDTINPIGTKFGIPVYPYKRYSSYYDYSSRNPYAISKSGSPYLYLTTNSGIRVLGDYNPLDDRGISIPINPNLSDSYRVVSLNLLVKYDRLSIPDSKIKLFEIESKNDFIRFYLEKVSDTRAKIYSINARTGAINNGIGFYINGSLVREPFVSLDKWTSLGVTFATPLDCDYYVGSLRVTSSVQMNNITTYKSTSLQEIERQELRNWLSVEAIAQYYDSLGWRYWDAGFTWNGVLVQSSTTIYGVTPEDIFRAYVGTNKIVVDNDESVVLKDYEYTAYSDVKWSSDTVIPV
jgi:hypothetical protein